MSKHVLAGVAVLALAMGGAAQAATPAKAGQGFNYSLISLTAQQKTQLAKAGARVPEQKLPPGLPGSPIAAGDMLPNSVKLTALPKSAQQKIRQETAGDALAQVRIGNLLSDDLVHARNGDVLVVDPIDRVVESVIYG